MEKRLTSVHRCYGLKLIAGAIRDLVDKEISFSATDVVWAMTGDSTEKLPWINAFIGGLLADNKSYAFDEGNKEWIYVHPSTPPGPPATFPNMSLTLFPGERIEVEVGDGHSTLSIV